MDEKYNINISIDKKSIQLCIDDKFYRITNTTETNEAFQLLGVQIMEMIDTIDDIMRYREIKGIKLDNTTYRKTHAFAQLLLNSIMPNRNDKQADRFAGTNVAQKTFQAIEMKQEDLKEKDNFETLKEYHESVRVKKQIKRAETEGAKFTKLVDAIIEEDTKEEEKQTLAQNINENPTFTFDQQYMIDLYVKTFGKNRVPRSEFSKYIKTCRYVKLFGGYTNYVLAAIA